ncbi:FdhF/YdeP family oxidoreductase [Aureibacter tunicatorum]|uniref:Molybdopterin-dependent oxidoreductase alpha subunit n=1 Tax=Aureibacter tunicatorum TaxID=866807 RepID=A0AAE3XMC2_9BACT|nr:FdhF/YdeP family oxidoreductase [Aureibacter tunicatorum]MDR6240546.1 molybdopterin-dependent oxidoreductase alpha subunit [Aureibacter tunicatorum]BDD06593.1 formate dehydrogenase [Aureibacter tunicatorum]
MKRKVQIVPPENFENLQLTPAKEKAAGVPGVVNAMKHISQELGIWQGVKLLNKMNQKDGFDCPGCAWPDPDGKRSSLGEYCENGVKAIAEEATNRRVTPDFFKKNSVETLSQQTDYWIGKSGRITHPMYLAKGSSHYEQVSWEKAFDIAASHFAKLESPDDAVFYTSGRTSNEAAYMYQLFARQLGTNNLPDCSNMCHESSGKGLIETTGIGKGSVTLEDLHQAEVIMVIGQNPGTNHPRMLSALAKCKENGGQVVSINPIPEAGNNVFVDPQNPMAIIKGGDKLNDIYMQVKINGDVALLKAVMLLMLEKEKEKPGSVFDLEFINEHTKGYDDFIKELEQNDFNEAVKESGIPESQVRQLAQLMIENDKIIICWAMGLTQHENGVQNIREVANLLFLKGSIGKPGAGTCPVRGHSNVQGDRTMGIWEKPKEAFLDNLDKRFNLSTPREHGYDAVEAIKAMDEGKVKIFMAMGGNFISATPDSEFTGKAVQNVDLTIQVSTKLNRSHLVTGKEALIFPCVSRSEEDTQNGKRQFITVENSMGIVHKSEGKFKPASKELLSEHAIIAKLADKIFGQKSTVNWLDMIQDYDNVREHIEATIPGFDNFNQRVRKPGGFYLPNGARERKFNTATGKANFTVNPIPKRKVQNGNFIMMTIRTHDQYNTTIYGMDDRYRGILNERRVVLMNPEDMKANGFKSESIVHLKSIHNGESRIANNFKIVPYNIARGCVGTYFPETNVLVHVDNTAKVSNTPASKFIEIEIKQA